MEGTESIFQHLDTTYRNDMRDSFTAAEFWLNDGPDAEAYKGRQGKSFLACHWLRHKRTHGLSRNTARWQPSSRRVTREGHDRSLNALRARRRLEHCGRPVMQHPFYAHTHENTCAVRHDID